MDTKSVEIKIVEVNRCISCLNGDVVTGVYFLDGRTRRYKEFRQYRDFVSGEKIRAEKIGSGKYAGYRF